MSSKWPLQFPVIKAASSVKIKVVSVSLGLALLGILAAYFRRKKKRVQNQNVKRQVPDGSEQNLSYPGKTKRKAETNGPKFNLSYSWIHRKQII
jgi:predicted lipase